MTEVQSTLWVGIITASSAIFGYILGAIISYFTTKQQFRASVLSGNRQQWINTLRDCIAEVHALALILMTDVELESKDMTDFSKKMERLLILSSKIHLLINPNETDHQELVNLVDEMVLSIEKDAKKDPNIRSNIIKKGQQILKKEWNRVKQGK